jgi:hypothetical protein
MVCTWRLLAPAFALMVDIPAKVLPTGEYTLMLSGFTHDGDIKEIADCSFGIVTR